MKYFALAAVLAGLAACSPSAPVSEPAPAVPAPAPVVADDHSKPPEGLAESFPNCTWSEVTGAGVSLWGYQCEGSKLVADAALPGVTLEMDLGGGEIVRAPVVRLFDIADGADIATILPAVRAASPAPGNEECVFEASKDVPGWFEFRPTGALAAKYQLFIDSKADEPVMPCGEMGPSESGMRYFMRLPGSATKVAVAFLPGDIPSYDMKSVKAAP